jgi:hypothetical protein
MDKVSEELEFIVKRAIARTIEERGCWGLGKSFLYPDLQSLTKSAEEKFYVKIIDSWHEEDATDWILKVEMLGKLRDMFAKRNLDAEFEVCVESSEEECDTFYDVKRVVVHNAYYAESLNSLLPKELVEELHRDILKITILMHMSEQ